MFILHFSNYLKNKMVKTQFWICLQSSKGLSKCRLGVCRVSVCVSDCVSVCVFVCVVVYVFFCLSVGLFVF
jgi:hypothetical protein